MIIKERQNNIKIILFNDFKRVTKLLGNLTTGRCAVLQRASVVPLLHPASAQVEDQLLRPAGGQVLKRTWLLFRLHLPWLSTAGSWGGWPWWRRWCWLRQWSCPQTLSLKHCLWLDDINTSLISFPLFVCIDVHRREAEWGLWWRAAYYCDVQCWQFQSQVPGDFCNYSNYILSLRIREETKKMLSFPDAKTFRVNSPWCHQSHLQKSCIVLFQEVGQENLGKQDLT